MENYLAHYGIKGQKWGIRRFQNKDGSRTPAGRKRYDKPHKSFSQRMTDKRIGKIRDRLIEDSKNVTAKADPGKYRMVYGKYERYDNPLDKYNILEAPKIARHIVDDMGRVRMSSIDTDYDGTIAVAAGKKYMNDIKLDDFTGIRRL